VQLIGLTKLNGSIMANKLSKKQIETLLANMPKPKQAVNVVDNTSKAKPRPEENPASKEAYKMFLGQLQRKQESQKRFINDAGPQPVYKNIGEKVRADLERESRQRDLMASIPNEKFNTWVENVGMPVADIAMALETPGVGKTLLKLLEEKGSSKTVKNLIEKKIKNKNNFKSEINWENWNPEIPNNKKLIEEYNAIEKNSKLNGTWMKNPDGS